MHAPPEMIEALSLSHSPELVIALASLGRALQSKTQSEEFGRKFGVLVGGCSKKRQAATPMNRCVLEERLIKTMVQMPGLMHAPR